jgi:hypothetical protein
VVCQTSRLFLLSLFTAGLAQNGATSAGATLAHLYLQQRHAAKTASATGHEKWRASAGWACSGSRPSMTSSRPAIQHTERWERACDPSFGSRASSPGIFSRKAPEKQRAVQALAYPPHACGLVAQVYFASRHSPGLGDWHGSGRSAHPSRRVHIATPEWGRNPPPPVEARETLAPRRATIAAGRLFSPPAASARWRSLHRHERGGHCWHGR